MKFRSERPYEFLQAASVFALASVAIPVNAALMPMPIAPESYNADVVVEKTAIPSLKVVTTATVDQGTNNGANTWMEIGYDPANPQNGLPAPGTIVTPPFGDVVFPANTVSGVNSGNPAVVNYSFKMPPDYTAPNGILIYGDGTNGLASGTFTLTTPAPYALLSFAGSGGNGGCVIGVTVHHQDGTTETGKFGCPDWFNGTSNVVLIANERCGSSVNFTYGNVNSGNPRIYFRDITLTNTTSPVTSIDLSYVSGPANSRNDVLAVSGATTLGGSVAPITVTGYTYDFIVEASAAKRGRVTAADGVTWATSHSMDNTANTGNSWYEMGYNINNPDGGGVPIPDPRVLTNSGLPVAGAMITNSTGDHIYQMPPDYTKSNAFWVAIPPAETNATIMLSTPTAASVLSLLGSAGNGPVNNLHLIIHHQDSTTQTNLVNVGNWFDLSPYVYISNGRVAVDTAQINNYGRTGNLNPRLYPIDLLLANGTSPVTSIEVINTNITGGRVAILAVSGTTDPIAPAFIAQPVSVTTNIGAIVQFSASAIANATITYQWQRGTNGVYVNLTDGGNISGATTTTLTVNPIAELDEADYRLVATDPAGSANSGLAVLTVLSPLLDVTAPTDPISAYQPLGGSSPDAEAVIHAIDDNTQKYLNRGSGTTPMSVPVGFVVKPSMGRTIVTGMRLYTANDTEARDPANYILEGSVNGITWTLITSNTITMPSARNAGGAAIDPLVQALRQVRFTNTVGYTTYRWYTTKVKGSDSLFQIGEVELLGVVDPSPAPYFALEPVSFTTLEGMPALFNAAANGTPTPTLRWQRNTGAGYVGLADGGNITGAQTGNLAVSPAGMSDVGDYICIAENTSGSVTSFVARLSVLSSLTDVTTPGDPITSFGDTSGATYPTENLPANAIDDSVFKYRNGGVGLNAFTGFPPYEGPAGIVVTPSIGASVVKGLRIYTANDAIERDPTAYELAGSTDGGTTYTPIISGVLDLPTARNVSGGLDPLNQPIQEVLFANTRAYTTYKLTVNHVRSDNDANSFQFGEMELLGVTGPLLSITSGTTPGTLSISTTLPGTLWSTADLVNWVSMGPLAPGTPVTITIGTDGPVRFYQIRP